MGLFIKLLFYRKNKGVRFHPLRQPKYTEAISFSVLSDIFDRCADFQYRSLLIGGRHAVYACYLDGLVSGTAVSEDVLRPLTDSGALAEEPSPKACLEALRAGGVYNYEATEPQDMDELVALLTAGSCALVFDTLHRALCFETRSEVMRSVEQPSTEKSVKGAKDAFTERLRVNTGLVRRRLRDSALKLEQCVVGRKSRTAAAMLYYDGIADPDKVQLLRRRLDEIDIDGLTASGHLEEYIVDCARSPFPQLLYTERPDKFAINLLEGRVGLLVDGLPMGFLVPVTLPQLMKVPDDISQHFLVASALSLLRYFSFLLSAVLPALLVAIAMYHQEMIPTRLLLSVIEAKQRVPFSTALEVIGMLLSFELLQEAGLHLPNPIGDTVSIIGALIVGQSAVEANPSGTSSSCAVGRCLR